MNSEFHPSLHKGAFYCPRCKVLTQHKHFKIYRSKNLINTDNPHFSIDFNEFPIGKPVYADPSSKKSSEKRFANDDWDLHISVCAHCFQYTIWEHEKMIFPTELNAPEPSPDMPVEVKSIYEEARLVYQYSSGASAALLRLAIETLIPKLDYGIKPDNLNNMIGKLVEKDIPEHIQKGLDVIRHYGNKGIHPGEIDIQEKTESVNYLFKLCNFMVDELISKKRKIDELYSSMPEGVLSHIEKRDKKK